MTRDNVAIGRKSSAIGSSFESWVEGQHDTAERLGILAHVEHNEPHSKIIHGRIQYVAAGVADYTGTLEGGRSLATEAKATTATRFPRSEVSRRQQDHLSAVAHAGGLALLIVEFRKAPPFRRYAVPWLLSPWKVARTAESIVEADIAEWEIQPGTCYLSRWHAGGPRSSPRRERVYPVE